MGTLTPLNLQKLSGFRPLSELISVLNVYFCLKLVAGFIKNLSFFRRFGHKFSFWAQIGLGAWVGVLKNSIPLSPCQFTQWPLDINLNTTHHKIDLTFAYKTMAKYLTLTRISPWAWPAKETWVNTFHTRMACLMDDLKVTNILKVKSDDTVL